MSYNNKEVSSHTYSRVDREHGNVSGRNERYIPREDHRDTREDRREDRSETILNPSICIPRTFTTIRGEQTKRAVFNTFRDLRVGHIERIDTVHKTDQRGERYCTVYVHLKWNMASKLARDTRQKLLDGQDVKIVYDEPWFWKCTMSTMEKPESRFPEKQERTTSRPRIDLGEGTRAVSRYTRDDRQEREREQEYEQEQERDERDERGVGENSEPNREQLCNMGSEDEE
jgi:hypothetical protein